MDNHLLQNYRSEVVDYFGKVAPIYGVKHGADMAGGRYGFNNLYRPLLAKVIKPGMEVLEIGCGNGASSEMLSSFGIKLTATDISEEMLKEVAKRKLPDTKLVCVDSMRLNEYPELTKYDVIIGFNSFSYFPDKGKVLRDMKSHLKPGGRLIILDMNPLCPLYWYSTLVGRNEMRAWWSCIKELTPRFLSKKLRETGYEVEDLRTLNFIPHKADHGIVFEVFKFLNPLLNAIPFVNRLAMRVMVTAKAV